jgi:uncharacterized protein (TIGR02284 family)
MQTLTTKDTAEILEDLIKINNDRIDGYEKAIKELKPEDNDLQLVFLKAIDQSRRIRLLLGNELQTMGESIPASTTGSGSIYRAWMEIKAVFTGHTRYAVLASCEYGEDAAQKAYETALESEHLPEYLSRIVLEEKMDLKTIHDQIKALRDQSA